MKLPFLVQKWWCKIGLEKIVLKSLVPLQRYLLTYQANSAILGQFLSTGQQQLWRRTWNFKLIFSILLFTVICNLGYCNPKIKTSRAKSLVQLTEWVLIGVGLLSSTICRYFLFFKFLKVIWYTYPQISTAYDLVTLWVE